MKGVGRNPKGDGKKKGGLKVHMLTDVRADMAVLEFIRIHLISYLDINWLVTEGRRYYKKSEKSKNKSPSTVGCKKFPLYQKFSSSSSR
jgi:hypothetical protein